MKKYKNTFRFSVAHAIKKNFILPLATFVLSMIFYLTGFCWDVLSEAKNKAAITGPVSYTHLTLPTKRIV